MCILHQTPKRNVWSKVIICLLILILSQCYCESLVNDRTKSPAKFFEESYYDEEHMSNVEDEVEKINREMKEGCIFIDGICITPYDVASYEAIKSLHAHLDDDQSGDIDLSESVDFLREELNYTKGLEKRQKAFHHNNDNHISVQELWDIWLENEVHNWTVEQTVGWLHVCVELGQYSDVFYENSVNGSLLPRLATNTDQYLYRILGIKNPTHRSKISIKAMDIVLFGPPKGSLIKDMFIASLIFVIVVLLFKFNSMSRSNNSALSKMDQEMEALQQELLRYHEEKQVQEDSSKKASPIKKDSTSKEPSEERSTDTPNSETGPWEDGSDNCLLEFPDWDTATMSDIPDMDLRTKNELQLWLQLTYEKERLVLENKVKTVKLQIEEARDMCDKLKPNRKNLFGALSFMHGKMESKGQPILEARAAFAEIQAFDKEMEYRWGVMERLLGFSIIQNGGLDHLRCILEPPLQASLSHSSTTAVGIASGNVEGSTEPSQSPVSRRSARDERGMRRVSALRSASSVVSDVGSESNASTFTTGSIRSRRTVNLPSFIKHSQTVESGLSTYGSDEVRPRSSSSEGKGRELSNGPHSRVNGMKTSSNGYLTDDTDSGNFTIGESNTTKIDSSSIGSQNTPLHSPSVTSENKQREEAPQRTLSEKNINKFSSEPSLESDETTETEVTDQEYFSKSKRGILSRSKFFKKFRSKPDKNK